MAWALSTRTGTVISRLVNRDTGRQRTVLPVDPKGIAVDAVGPDAYRRDDEFRQHVIRHFRRNLNRMVDIAEEAGAKVLFVVPASNLFDFSPFRSESSPGLTPEKQGEFEWNRWSWFTSLDPANVEKVAAKVEEAMIHGRA